MFDTFYFNSNRKILRAVVMLVVLVCCVHTISLACACGCNVFTVGPRWMMATTTGTTFSFQYNYMNQYNNWSGTSIASPDSNGDKQILTSFYTLGFQTMINREWGI